MNPHIAEEKTEAQRNHHMPWITQPVSCRAVGGVTVGIGAALPIARVLAKLGRGAWLGILKGTATWGMKRLPVCVTR